MRITKSLGVPLRRGSSGAGSTMSQLVLTPGGTLSVFWIQDSGKEAAENLDAVVMELERHLC